jgi:pyruvate dehydrogenase E2 component (dihydrolipoamide acetyltransferase)
MKSEDRQQLPWPDEDYSLYGSVDVEPLGKMQHYIGRVLHRNWAQVPQVTHHDDVDVTLLEHARQEWNEQNPKRRKSLLAVVMKAVVGVLKEYPQFNSSLSADGKTLYLKKYFNIGFALDVPEGLLVPVIKGCDEKATDAISSEVEAVSSKAHARRLSVQEMSGGCFTVSSLGQIGGSAFTPIVNAPEVAILGVSRSKRIFVPDEAGNPCLRRFLPLSLTYDHRVINGADAARFCRAMANSLATFEIES